MAHKNLDVISMAMRKQTAYNRASGWCSINCCAVFWELTTVEFTGARGLLELLSPLGKLGYCDCCGLPLSDPLRIF